MKKLIVYTIYFLFVFIQNTYCQSQSDDTVWTKQLWQFGNDIKQVEFTKQGNSIAVAIGNGVYVYDIMTGSLVKQFTKNVINIQEFLFSEGSDSLITYDFGDQITIWDYKTGDSLKSFKNWTIYMNLLEPNLILSAIGKADSNKIVIWDLNTGSIIKSSEPSGNIYGIKLLKKSNMIAVALARGVNPSYTFSIELWDLNNLERIMTLGYHTSKIQVFAASTDEKFLASVCDDGIVKIWDLTNRILANTITPYFKYESVNGLIFSHGSAYLITGGGGYERYTTKIWDLKTFSLVYTYNHPFGSNAIDINQDSTLIIGGSGYYLFLLKGHWPITGIDEPIDNEEQLLYPNPGTNDLTIPLNQMAQADEINLINTSGSKIKSINNIPPNIKEIKIDIAEFPNGNYFAIVAYPTKTITYKFEK